MLSFPALLKRTLGAFVIALLLAGSVQRLRADPDRWDLYGSGRFRYDKDTGSKTGQPDRNRLRLNAELGLAFKSGAHWRFDLRERTDPKNNPQRSNNTLKVFGAGTYGQRGFHADVWQAAWKPRDDVNVVVGRMLLPFWQAQDTIWDDDVTILGAFGALSLPGAAAGAHRTLRAGAFTLPDGMTRFYGSLWVAQIEERRTLGQQQLRAALSTYVIDGDDNVRHTNSEDAGRDYWFGVLDLQWTVPLGRWPLTVAAVGVRNFESYDSSGGDRYAAAFHDQRWGGSVGFRLGRRAQPGDVLFIYRYLYVEALAADPIIAQEGVTRLSSTDLKAHEIGFRVTLPHRAYVQPKVHLAERLSDGEESVQYRLDVGWSF